MVGFLSTRVVKYVLYIYIKPNMCFAYNEKINKTVK